jgi:steroid delta-isomerase-like uncharacterized protein
MTTEEERNKERLREYVQECWIEGNLDRLEEYVAEDYLEHNPATPHDIEGIEGHWANIAQFREAFPDMAPEFDRIVADGNKTAQLFTVRGTHEGELMGTPPTGKSVTFPAVGITVWEDGKMVEDWSQVDMLGMMEQLGLSPEPETIG